MDIIEKWRQSAPHTWGLLGLPHGDPSSQLPSLIFWMKLLHYSGGVTQNNGIGGYGAGYQGICPDDRVFSDHQFTLATHDRNSEANPALFLNSDCAAFCYSLERSGNLHILERVVVIRDEGVGGYHDVSLQVDPVLGRDLNAPPDPAAIFQDDDGFVGLGRIRNINPGGTMDLYAITDLHTTCD